jgi:pimeloyl-ACP methyl ester carboxylesterase
MEEIIIRGLRIAFEQKGSGTPLVLLHGALSDSRVWRRQLDELSDNYTVVAWDAPGCGKSDDPPKEFLLSDYADCLAAFIHGIGLKKPHILGLSFGGGLALSLYQQYPAIPRSLILASAYAGWAGSLPPEVVEERLRNGIKQSKLPPDQVVEAWMPTLFDDSVPAEIVNEMAAIMSEFHPAGMKAMLNAFAKADLSPVLSTITIPVLLLYGETDQRSPLNIARNLNKNIPESQLVIIPETGHVLNLEAHGIFNKEIRNFLEGKNILMP